MKLNKITVVILSIAMSFSIVLSSVEVFADETSLPTETQKTETIESKEPKETEKQEPKETEKQEPKETEKQEPKETEKQEPKETEKETSGENDTNNTIEGSLPKQTYKQTRKNGVASSGQCGSNVFWKFDNSILTITGNGKMDNWSNEEDVPWYSFRENIQHIDISNTVSSIGINAFAGCTSLTEIIIPYEIISFGDNAFKGCTNLTFVVLNSSTNYWSRAFPGFSNTCFRHWHKVSYATDGHGTVTGNKTVTYRGDLVELNITPSNGYLINKVMIINSSNSYEMKCNSEGKYVVPITLQGSTTSVADTIKVTFKVSGIINGTCGDNLTWTMNTNTGKLSISGSGDMYDWNKESEIPWSDYKNNITSVDLPNGLTSIGYIAFDECEGLKSITIPNSVKRIGIGAFAETGLTSVIIPESVTTIERSAFAACRQLKNVTLPKGLITIDEGTFGGTALTSIIIPDSVTTIGKQAFQSTALTSIIIPASVTTIGEQAFYGCKDLAKVNILHNGYINYGSDAFSNCSSISEVIMFYNSAKTAFKEIWGNSDIFHFYTKTIYENDGNGTISGNEYTYATEAAEFSIIPKENYVLDKVTWSEVYGNRVVELTPNTNGKFIIPDTTNHTNGLQTRISATFTRVYNISSGESLHGKVSVSKSVAFDGEEVTFTITPDAGYEIETVKINGTETTNRSITIDKCDVIIDVTYRKINYSITISNVLNGTVEVSSINAGIGDEITVTASPNEGYYLDTISVNGKPINGTTFIMPAENVIVEVTFSERLSNTLNAKGGKTAKVKYKKLRKKAQTVTRSKVMTIGNAQGNIKYSLVSVKRGKSKKYKKYFKISTTSGNVTVKKKLKKGTYTITCKVTASGNDVYRSVTKTVSFKIKVK